MMALLRTELEGFADRYAFTPREQDVVYLLMDGVCSVADIASGLGLSRNTVHNHFKNVFRRTSTTNKASLMALFIRESMSRQAQHLTFVKWPSVLLVGRETDACRRLRAGLDQRGMLVHEARNDEAALSAVAEFGIDVVVAGDAASVPAADLRAQITNRFGRRPPVLGSAALLAGTEGLAGAAAEGSSANDALVFRILESFVDSPYERSRLLRVETRLRGRLADGVQVRIVNLAFGGAFIAMSQEQMRALECLAVESPFELLIDLPTIPAVVARCRVAWRRTSTGVSLPSGLGVRFEEVAAPARVALEAYVRRHKLVWLSALGLPTGRPRALANG